MVGADSHCRLSNVCLTSSDLCTKPLFLGFNVSLTSFGLTTSNFSKILFMLLSGIVQFTMYIRHNLGLFCTIGGRKLKLVLLLEFHLAIS